MSIHIIRNESFYQLKGAVTHSEDVYDKDPQQMTYDLRNKSDVINFVRSDYGHEQIRDSKNGEHQYIELPEKSGFIFIPNRDQNKATFITLYKTPDSDKRREKFHNGEYEGLNAKRLTNMAQVYMYTYNSFQEQYFEDPKLLESDKYRFIQMSVYRDAIRSSGLTVRPGDSKATIDEKIEAWVRTEEGQDWLDDEAIISQTFDYSDRQLDEDTPLQRHVSAAKRHFNKKMEEALERGGMTGFKRVNLNPTPEQVRGYHNLRSTPSRLTGTRIKVPKEVWSEISQMMFPEAGHQSSGEKAYHYETGGRN